MDSTPSKTESVEATEKKKEFVHEKKDAETRKKEKEEKARLKEEKRVAAELKKKQLEEEKAKGSVQAVKDSTHTIKYYESNAKLVRPNLGEKIKYDPSMRNILITSALPYVNNVPHLGNLIGCVLSADVYARYCRLMGYNTLYICGTDENGTATEVKAIQEGCTPIELCDKYYELHAGIYKWFDIDFDYFGRTSRPIHSDITQDIFKDLFNNNFIKKHLVDQFYCEHCKLSLADKFIVGTCPKEDCKYDDAKGDQCDKCGRLINAFDLINPHCLLCKNPPTPRKSSHYYLSLPETENDLIAWINKASDEGFWSQNSKNITFGFLKEGLRERCITRDLKFGVPVPCDTDPDMKGKIFYVWFDAPIGYISITADFLGDEWKNWWLNPDHIELYQFMGKDNVTFHTIIFPSSLIGTKKPFTKLKHISTTDYLNYEDKKFSKTRGIGVFGDNASITGIPPEVWRYYLLINRPETADTVFQWDDLAAKNNGELLKNLGNLTNRVLTFLTQFENVVPPLNHEKLREIDINFLKKAYDLVNQYHNKLELVKIKDGLKIVMELSGEGNEYMQKVEPWVVIKTDKEQCGNYINILVNVIRLIACIAEPYMPSFSAKIYEILNIKYDEKQSTLLRDIINGNFETILKLVEPSTEINKPLPLFKEITPKEIAEFKAKFG